MDAIVDNRDLVTRARAGDRAAFAVLIEAHYDPIFRAAYKWCGHRSDAEDIAQEVCIKLAGAIRQFDGQAALSSWIYRITINAVRDLQRAQSRQRRNLAAHALAAGEEALAGQEDAMALGEVWAAVRRLPEQQRDAVLLVYAEDLSHSEAAEIMGCKEATVSWHIHQARKTLRGLL